MNHRRLFIAARILSPIVFVHFLKNFATFGGLLALIWADLTLAKPGGGARA